MIAISTKAARLAPAASENQRPNTTNTTEPAPYPQPAEGAYTSRRRFLVWVAMCGHIGPEPVVERILADLADEVQP